MIAIVWAVLAALLCGGIYGAGRVLARDDMPLTDLPSGERGCSSQCSAATTRTAVTLPGPDREVVQRFSNRAGEPGPGGGGSARSSSAAGQSTYQVLYAMVIAVNDAWLDRLFAGGGGMHCG